jgi:sugar phosphate isomerase/epimerase
MSLSLAGITEPVTTAPGPRALIEWAATLGYKAVHLDAALPGIRPRELDRSARRDLASLLRRLQLEFSGLDLWVPPAHFLDPAQQDRAVSAVVGALELASELARLLSGTPIVSMALPDKVTPSVLDSLRAAADLHGCTLADHAWPSHGGDSPLAIGIDPAELLAARLDPAAEVSRLAAAPVAARLSDYANAGRVTPGKGQLDVLAYQVALATKGYRGFTVVDLRRVPNQVHAAKHVLELTSAW